MSGSKSPLLENMSTSRIMSNCTNVAVGIPSPSPLTIKHSHFVYQDVLGDVVAYVEVRSDVEDLSLLFGEHLLYLGATVTQTFNKKVTHIVFKRGRESTFNKAMKWNIPVVSIIWVDRCKKENRHVPEEPYLIKDYKTYGKRLKLPYNCKNTSTIENNVKSFMKTKNIIENIKSKQRNENVMLAPETPEQNENESACHDDYPTPAVIPETIFPGTSKRKNNKKITSKITEPMKRKLFVDRKEYFFGSPSSKLTRVDNKIKLLQSPLKNPKTKVFKLKNSTRSEINAKSRINELNCRQSLDDFKISEPLQSISRRKRKIDKETKTMVFTSFNATMSDAAFAIVKTLGDVRVIKNVTKETTHVICGENKRTLNLLYGLMYGCFILDQEWLMRSLEAGKWLDENYFQLIEYFPSAQVRKPEIRNIFKDCGLFFISFDSSPPFHDLANLITLGGGVVTTCYRKAKIIVGNFKNYSIDENPEIKLVDEKAILDCISGFKKFTC